MEMSILEVVVVLSWFNMSKYLAALFRHPDEFPALLQMAKMAKDATKLPEEPNLCFCYDMLNKVSRSFAIVIQQLPRELRDAVCVFYLVLRALDTVEDDMAISKKEKVPMLRIFYKKCYDPKFTYPCGTKHYKVLMDEYPKVVNVFLSLKKPYQDVIADITRRMGEGMADFIESEVVTLKDWDQYCHYVAGLVGIGLSNLFAGSGLEDARYGQMDDLSNHMGLLLQKTNIIRDYMEDICEEPAPRMFWPKDVWRQYAAKLEDFKEKGNRRQAVRCMNHLITNALQHVPRCLEYMEGLRDPMIFRFCALPQVMAIATLALCYDNGRVFEGVVKMRRGLTAKTMLGVNDIDELYRQFAHYLEIILSKARAAKDDPMQEATIRNAKAARDICAGRLWRRGQSMYRGTVLGMFVRCLLFLALAYYAAQGLLPHYLAHAQGAASDALATVTAQVPPAVFSHGRSALALAQTYVATPLAPVTAAVETQLQAAFAAVSPVVAEISAKLQQNGLGPKMAAGLVGLLTYVHVMKALPDPIC